MKNEEVKMKDEPRFERWLEPEPVFKNGPSDEPAIDPAKLEKHFTKSQIEFIKKRIAMDSPDLRSMAPEQLNELFARDGGINDARIIMTFLVQYFLRFKEGEDSSIRGNLKSFWYRKLARSLERLGRLDLRGGLSVKSAGSRSRYLLKTMEDSFEQLFLQEFFHYRDLDVYNHRESFRLMGRDEKRHLFYTEKEGLFWFCETVHDRYSCHAFASRGSATWLDVDYLAEAIGKLTVRNLYIAALTDYDPWGLYIAKQMRRKLESSQFGFRKVKLEVITDLEIFDPEVIQREKRYLLTGHEDPKDPVHQIVQRWVKNGGGINGEPYGMHVDNFNPTKTLERVDAWIKGKWSSRLANFEFPAKLMKAAQRRARSGGDD